MENLKWNYDVIRFWLFTQSYVSSVLVNVLRNKYKIPIKGVSRSRWRKEFDQKHADLFEKRSNELTHQGNGFLSSALRYTLVDELTKEITPEITNIAKALDLDENNLRNFILYNIISNKENITPKVLYVNPSKFITEEGVYIKVDERIDVKKYLKTLSKIKSELKIVSKLKVKTSKLLIKERRRKDIGKEDKGKIEFYCLVEKQIKKLVIEKNSNKYLRDELNKGQLVNIAITGVADELLDRRSKDQERKDNVFDKWIVRVNTFYREIISRYMLPSPKKLPSILRLINP